MTNKQLDALEALKKVAQDSLDSGLSKSEIFDAIQKLDSPVTEKSEAPETVRVDDVIDRGTYSRPFPTRHPIKT